MGFWRWSAGLVCALVMGTASGPALAETGKIALTFDDLPGLSLYGDQAYVDYLNIMLIRGLKRHHLPAIGFVNESKLDDLDRPRQIANLERWLDAGMNLGNHTFSHESPDQLGAADYVLDIARGEPVTRALLAKRRKPLNWFRYPFLETGAPAAVKHQINDWLKTHGYRIAPVTVDADDWEFAEPYDDALSRHDEARRLRIRRQYLDHTERTIAWSQKASHALFERQIPLVILLHDTRLNADCIDDLAEILKRRNLRAVTLEEAMKDPAYQTPDPYVGHDGIEWLERWSNALHRALPWDSWQDPPAQIVEEYNRTSNDHH